MSDEQKDPRAKLQVLMLRAKQLGREYKDAPERERGAILEQMKVLSREMAPFRAALKQEFIQQLVNRQGTTMPDFDSLYRRKDELDRELFGRDEP